MNEARIGHLLRPKFYSVRRRMAQGGSPLRVMVMGTVGLAFWGLLFGILYRLLHYFRGVDPEIGDVLAAKLLALILLAFLAVLLLSNIITALSSFFLARDLELVNAAPVDGLRTYGARLLETCGQSSWMVALVMVPVLIAYGGVFDAGALFLLVAAAALPAFAILPAVVGSAFTLTLVNVFPARRMRDLLALMGLFGAAALVVLLRMLRPERLVRPEGFSSVVDFIAALETPASSWLPSTWAADALMTSLNADRSGDMFPLLLLVTTAAALVVLGGWLHQKLYSRGFSRAREGAEQREEERGGGRLDRWLRPLSTSARGMVAKDIRVFFRDTTQWSQLVLLAVLVAIYVYNIRVLPLHTGESIGFFLTNVISFLNLGLAGFVLAAIAVRFIFPAVSLEGGALWLLRSSPLDLRTLLWSKYWVGIIPLLVLAFVLTLATNLILRVDGFVMAVSLVSIVVITFAIASLALGFGAAYPRFEASDAAQVATGFGGLLFMMTATGYVAIIVVLEAWPVYAMLRADARGVPLDGGDIIALVIGFGLALVLSAAAILLPMRVAVRRIEATAA